jgi:hypothetical protein
VKGGAAKLERALTRRSIPAATSPIAVIFHYFALLFLILAQVLHTIEQQALCVKFTTSYNICSTTAVRRGDKK